MSSGISVDDECLSLFQELKLKKRFRYLVYGLSEDNRSIVVISKKERSGIQGSHSTSGGSLDKLTEVSLALKEEYKEFVKGELPEDDCRYAVYDFEYEKSASEGLRNKICFVVWAPDTAKVKQKMLYASSKDAIRKKLVGIATEIQATDSAEIAYETVLDRISSFQK